jgi:hypothetical protein
MFRFTTDGKLVLRRNSQVGRMTLLWRHDIQHSNTQHNDIQHDSTRHYDTLHNVVCFYPQCHL